MDDFEGNTHHFRKHPYNDWNDVMIQRVYFINYGSRDQLLAPITPTFPCDDSRDSGLGGGHASSMGMGVPRAWESLEDLELLDWKKNMFFFFFRNKNVAARGEFHNSKQSLF